MKPNKDQVNFYTNVQLTKAIHTAVSDLEYSIKLCDSLIKKDSNQSEENKDYFRQQIVDYKEAIKQLREMIKK